MMIKNNTRLLKVESYEVVLLILDQSKLVKSGRKFVINDSDDSDGKMYEKEELLENIKHHSTLRVRG